MASIKTAKLTLEHQQAYDDYLAAKAAAEPLRGLDVKRKDAQKTLLSGFGEMDFGRLPDGRVIQRVKKGRNVPASEARRDEWFELNEVAA